MMFSDVATITVAEGLMSILRQLRKLIRSVKNAFLSNS